MHHYHHQNEQLTTRAIAGSSPVAMVSIGGAIATARSPSPSPNPNPEAISSPSRGTVTKCERKRTPLALRSNCLNSARKRNVSRSKSDDCGGRLLESSTWLKDDDPKRSRDDLYYSEKKARITSPIVRLSDRKLSPEILCTLQGGISLLELRNVTLPEPNSLLIQTIMASRSTLMSLCISKCSLDDMFITELSIIMTSPSTALPHFRKLDVSSNIITYTGALALANALKSNHCLLQELNASNNKLSVSAIRTFASELPFYRHLKVLRLADREHLLPSSVLQLFRESVEKNAVLQVLTVGCETMDGRSGSCQCDLSPANKLFRFWEEDAYTDARTRILFLLRLNGAGFRDMVELHPDLPSRLCNLLLDSDIFHSVEQTVEAFFRILQWNPNVLLSLKSVR